MDLSTFHSCYISLTIFFCSPIYLFIYLFIYFSSPFFFFFEIHLDARFKKKKKERTFSIISILDRYDTPCRVLFRNWHPAFFHFVMGGEEEGGERRPRASGNLFNWADVHRG